MSKFLVIEKPQMNFPLMSTDQAERAKIMKLIKSEIEYKTKLQKQGKIVGGGPFLDISAVCYILNVPTVEEMGEVFFNSPMNPWTDREVHPLGTFADTLEGFKEMTH